MDLSFTDHGSIWLLNAVSEAGQGWIDDFIDISSETQYWGGGIVVEPRYVADIALAATRDGLAVEV